MTHHVLLGMLLLPLVFGILPAQPPDPAAGANGAEAPPLTFSPKLIEYGRISDEASVKRSVAFRNRGDRPISITKIHGSCGCVVPTELSKKTYQPGEEGELEIAFNPVLRQGKERKTVTVETDDPVFAKLTFDLTVEVVPRLGIEPRVHFFGEFERGVKAPPKSLVLTVREPWVVVESVELPDSRFRLLKKAEAEIEEAGKNVRRIEYEVTFLGDAEVGRVQASVLIKSNIREVPVMNVAMLADVVGEVRAFPDRLALRIAPGGTALAKDFTVFSRVSKPFALGEPTLEGFDGMELSIRSKGGDPRYQHSYMFSIEGVSPPAPEAGQTNLFSGAVRFTTDIEDQPELIVPVTLHLLAPVSAAK